MTKQLDETKKSHISTTEKRKEIIPITFCSLQLILVIPVIEYDISFPQPGPNMKSEDIRKFRFSMHQRT